ncbi:MAG: protein-disulfide reductase DsbD domain-containing protein, partial [Thermoanaerobaculia bacterium]
RIVTARLIADTVRVQPGTPFTAGVHLTIAPGWHVYWENPGDTALPVLVEWRLPPGGTASPLRWPQPEKVEESGGMTVFGYEDEVVLLTTVSPPEDLAGDSFRLEAKAEWLVCEKLCIPGDALMRLALPLGDAAPSDDAATIQRFAAMVPRAGAAAGVRIADARASGEGDEWSFRLDLDAGGRRILDFYPRITEGFFFDHGGIDVRGETVELSALADAPDLVPRRIGGVVVTDRGSFDVSADVGAGDEPPAEPSLSTAATSAAEQGPPSSSDPPPSPPADPSATSSESSSSASLQASVATDWLARDFTSALQSRRMSLATLLLFALLGGLLLNVMPCVLPVISLKVLSFVHQSGESPRRARSLGLMFAAGVLVSFWILVAVIVALRATAAEIGWGFQFQSPVFVLVMSAVVVVFAMNLFGVFEIRGFSFGSAVAGGQGAGGAFVHGVLATAL